LGEAESGDIVKIVPAAAELRGARPRPLPGGSTPSASRTDGHRVV